MPTRTSLPSECERECETHTLSCSTPTPSPSSLLPRTFRTSVIKKLDIGSHLDFGEELSETLQPPFCEGPVPTKPAHTLQHLQGVARRTEVTLEPDKHVQQLFVPSIT